MCQFAIHFVLVGNLYRRKQQKISARRRKILHIVNSIEIFSAKMKYTGDLCYCVKVMNRGRYSLVNIALGLMFMQRSRERNRDVCRYRCIRKGKYGHQRNINIKINIEEEARGWTTQH